MRWFEREVCTGLPENLPLDADSEWADVPPRTLAERQPLTMCIVARRFRRPRRRKK